MSNKMMNVSIPLDGQFLRRECSYCKRQFKVLIPEEELKDIIEKLADASIDNEESNQDVQSEESNDLYCPYCQQQASKDSWWTEEQIQYIHTFVENYAKELMNEHLIGPMKKMFKSNSSSFVKIKFEGDELKPETPWIHPEINDMREFDLPCCNKNIKIEENWIGEVKCFYCGFPHKQV